MCHVPTVLAPRRVVRVALAGLTAALLAGCAETRTYLGDPLGNPFKTASTDRTPTGSTDPDMAPPAPYRARSGAVESQPLAAPAAPSRVASYETPAYKSPRLSPTYAAPRTDRTASIAAPSGHGAWSAHGGMPVIAANGETAAVLAARYNVPTDALLRANGFSSAAQVRAGTRIVIPVYTAGARPTEVAKVEIVRKPKDHSSRERLLAKRETGKEKVVVRVAAPAQGAVKKVVVKEKVIARHEAPESREVMHWKKGPQPAKLAKAEKVKVIEKVRVIEKGKPGQKPRVVEKTVVVEQAQVARVEAPAKMRAVDPTPTASLPPAQEKVAASGAPEFRWPAHGRIIQGFKSAGNDGINIAVPAGTSVKAAESGVVAYAGSEIKGFGNLVLIRHPNGYVSAYANNGSLDVHRGEQVRRGQTIAKSGQSGNVASPQLHFELRKGSTPVDPTRYLAGL